MTMTNLEKNKWLVNEQFCECGCGGLAPVITMTVNRLSYIKGQSFRFIHGHRARKNHPMQGKKRPDLSKRMKENNPAKIPYVRIKISEKAKQRRWSEGYKLKKSINNRGKNNPNWQGGKSSEPYSSEWNRYIREQMRERDNFTCQRCGITETDLKLKSKFHKKLSVHHKDSDKKNTKSENLIALCVNCHTKIHRSLK